MLKNIFIPPSFSLIKKEKVLLLLNDKYKDFLLQEKIEDLETFLKRHDQNIYYLSGRTSHPSILMKDGERMVIRFYSHGGLLRAFTRDLYFFGSRSFRELVLTEDIRSCGIPTIQPIGAVHRFTIPLFYRAYIISLEVPHAMDLVQYFEKIGSRPSRENIITKRKIIRLTGILIRKFHQKGFFHGDLQLKNILLSREQLLLIDFDRSYRKPVLAIRKRVKNLLRLNRSAEKWKHLGLSITRTDRLRFLLAYAGEEVKFREVMQKALRAYRARLFLYQLAWRIERILGSSLFKVHHKTLNQKLQTNPERGNSELRTY